MFKLSFKIIELLVLEKILFKFFTIYGHGGHLGHVTRTIYINFRSPFPRRLHIKFGIRKTCPCNVHPLTPHFYIVKLGFTGLHNFLIFALKHRLGVLVRIASVPTIYVLSKNKNIIIFYLKFFIFTAVKNRCVLHGHVFVIAMIGQAVLGEKTFENGGRRQRRQQQRQRRRKPEHGYSLSSPMSIWLW